MAKVPDIPGPLQRSWAKRGRGWAMAQTPDVMTVEEAAAYLRVTPRAVKRARYERGLPACAKFKGLRFRRSDIDKWLSKIGVSRDNRNRDSKANRGTGTRSVSKRAR